MLDGILAKCLTECRTYSNISTTGFVDPVHMFTELWPVAISVSVVLGHKQQRVNHFMKESLQKKR